MIASIKHSLLVFAGTISLALGVLGVFLPLLPTVPLILLAGYCFARSSKRMHTWLINNQHFGTIIRNFESGQGLARRVKVRAITVVWISMGISCLIVARPLLCTMLAAIGLGVSIYLWRLPELAD